MKINYSEPKFYTGGVDVNQWSKLSKKEQKEALEKEWYVYYTFRNPKTGKLTRQTNIKGGVNKHKDRRTRLHLLNVMKESLLVVLREGFNPYEDNRSLTEYLLDKLDNKQKAKTKKKEVRQASVEIVEQVVEDNSMTIKEAFELALDLKMSMMSPSSFMKFKSRINNFTKWIKSEGLKDADKITSITKKHVIQYLNNVLQRTSPRNRNNSRTDLASFYQVLEDNDVIRENFVKKINVLKALPSRNKTYKPKEQEEIFKYLREHDPTLFLYVQFISYNYLRPIEVCRLKIGDLDLQDKKLYVKAKNKPVKIKIIPDILIKELPDLSKFSKEDYLFAETNIGGQWETEENNKRDFYTKRFKKVKDHFGLGVDYGLYSFRHTFITKLYKEMAKNATAFEVKSKLQLITGHATMKALEQYLRDVDAELPEDYSALLK
ncbi:tyrosine-type recombinase/integrase [Aestuariibaculum sediminum]|nr:site-specific integrase [Aestuariibaculum sediminum]